MGLRNALFVVILLIVGCPPRSTAAEVENFDQALVAASRTGGIAFVEFFTTWCGPCRTFAKALGEDPSLRALADEITLARIDAESESGRAVAARFDVRVYPTFVALDPDGEELMRWSGYTDPGEFIERVRSVQADPRRLEARFEEFAATPTPDGAGELAEVLYLSGRYEEAVRYYEREIELAPERAPDVYPRMFKAYRTSVGYFIPVDWTPLEVRARKVFAQPELDPGERVRITYTLRNAAKLDLEVSRYLQYLEAALEVEIDPADRNAAWCREFLADDRRILVAMDGDGAVAERYARLSVKDDTPPQEIMWYAMWCADHSVDLQRAEQLVEDALAKGVGDRVLRGFLMSTLADVRFADGRYNEAVRTLEDAIEVVPEFDQLRLQLVYFRDVEAGPDGTGSSGPEG